MVLQEEKDKIFDCEIMDTTTVSMEYESPKVITES